MAHRLWQRDRVIWLSSCRARLQLPPGHKVAAVTTLRYRDDLTHVAVIVAQKKLTFNFLRSYTAVMTAGLVHIVRVKKHV